MGIVMAGHSLLRAAGEREEQEGVGDVNTLPSRQGVWRPDLDVVSSGTVLSVPRQGMSAISGESGVNIPPT